MKLFLFILLIVPNASLVFASDVSWKVWKKNSLQNVSYRPTKLNDEDKSQLIEIKATTKVHSTISAFLSFIQDVNNTPNWLVNTSESQILKQYSNKEVSFYIKLANLWPLTPRILMLHSQYWQNKNLSVEIMLTDLNAKEDSKSITSRITKLEQYLPIITHSAHWTITPIPLKYEDERDIGLLIEYQFIADGRGNTPKWLANHLALKSIWKSMRNIRRQLPGIKWQQQKISGITELSIKEKAVIPE